MIFYWLLIRQVSIVGDFLEEDIESCILDYLGTVGVTNGFERAQRYSPIIFQQSASSLHFQQVRSNEIIKLSFLQAEEDEHIPSNLCWIAA